MVHLGGLVLFTCSLWTFIVPLNVAVGTEVRDRPQVIGSSQPIMAVLGEDVILPCHLEPKFNVEGFTVEWSNPDLKPDPADQLSRVEYVHLYRGRREDQSMKIRSYVMRTALFTDDLKDGNISLKILNVTLSDQGRYRCFIPKLKSQVKESIVQLVVAPRSDETSTTETQLDPRNLPNPDDPDDETDVEDRPQVIGSSQPIMAVLGEDVILPCHLEPKFNVEGFTVEWSNPDLKPDPADQLSRVEYIHLYRDRREDQSMKIRSYVMRTALFTDDLKDGNISLKILNVTLSDQGRYRCFIPKLKSQVKESIVQLVVAPRSDETSTTETQLDPRNLPNPDDPDDETDVEVGRHHFSVLIPMSVCVLLILAAGVGALLHKRNHQNLNHQEV
ncbi:uncharacterized protein LOC129093437 [Anoplopoma fimbria]|uniref:uncharacterized protein LOC129093437 n=1 Tax=Anoplopoma fimbria TaxID=229290 RepID=UPI0023EE28CA|nr:uncharacterized protein LOC129093437 [Anoplopoma fimbria]